MKRRSLLIGGAFSGWWMFARSAETVPVLGGPCEGCEWVFDSMPARISTTARIAPMGESGVPLVIEGVVRTSDGKPAPGIIVYAYHTDDTGIYPRAQNRHGRLRGWARTDAEGRYRFDTIRPRAYPGRDVPEHVHMHIIEPGKGTYYIDSLRFEDDPLITAANRAGDERGGNGLARPEHAGNGWRVRRDIILGQNIPGHR
jgi:protocatechuate 3,4-dioxygenase beta subunit